MTYKETFEKLPYVAHFKAMTRTSKIASRPSRLFSGGVGGSVALDPHQENGFWLWFISSTLRLVGETMARSNYCLFGAAIHSTRNEIADAGAGREEIASPLAAALYCMVPPASQTLAAGSAFVFPGRSSNDKPCQHGLVDDHARLKSPYTVHGFRSAFRDWASERTNFCPRDLRGPRSPTSSRTRPRLPTARGGLFEKRRELMATGASFVTAEVAMVVPIRSSGASPAGASRSS